MFWARMDDIEVISSLLGYFYLVFKKNGPVKNSIPEFIRPIKGLYKYSECHMSTCDHNVSNSLK